MSGMLPCSTGRSGKQQCTLSSCTAKGARHGCGTGSVQLTCRPGSAARVLHADCRLRAPGGPEQQRTSSGSWPCPSCSMKRLSAATSTQKSGDCSGVGKGRAGQVETALRGSWKGCLKGPLTMVSHDVPCRCFLAETVAMMLRHQTAANVAAHHSRSMAMQLVKSRLHPPLL